MSAMTFKAGVEEAIKRDVPEIKGIEVINLR
jgi:Fe-S cluster biogenesis protein NfuA